MANLDAGNLTISWFFASCLFFSTFIIIITRFCYILNVKTIIYSKYLSGKFWELQVAKNPNKICYIHSRFCIAYDIQHQKVIFYLFLHSTKKKKTFICFNFSTLFYNYWNQPSFAHTIPELQGLDRKLLVPCIFHQLLPYNCPVAFEFGESLQHCSLSRSFFSFISYKSNNFGIMNVSIEDEWLM